MTKNERIEEAKHNLNKALENGLPMLSAEERRKIVDYVEALIEAVKS